MGFSLIPAAAQVIDFSGVEDVERERLEVTFENGHSLLFMASRRGTPWVELDRHATAGSFVATEKMIMQLAERFYFERIHSQRFRRTLDFIRTQIDRSHFPRYNRPPGGWTVEEVARQFEVSLYCGSGGRPSDACVGLPLEVNVSLRYSNTYRNVIPWGNVVSIENYVIQPTTIIAANYA